MVFLMRMEKCGGYIASLLVLIFHLKFYDITVHHHSMHDFLRTYIPQEQQRDLKYAGKVSFGGLIMVICLWIYIM